MKNTRVGQVLRLVARFLWSLGRALLRGYLAMGSCVYGGGAGLEAQVWRARPTEVDDGPAVEAERGIREIEAFLEVTAQRQSQRFTRPRTSGPDDGPESA